MQQRFLQLLIDPDKALSARLAATSHHRTTRWLAHLLVFSSDGPVWLLIVLLLCWRHHPLAWQLWWALFCAAITTACLKSIFRRPRPAPIGRNIAADKYAFPSGHATRASAVAITIGTAVCDSILPLFSWAILVALARVILARHYLLDVLAGLSLGLFIGLGLLFL